MDIHRDDIIRQRLYRNGLLQPFATPLECIHALTGIQSQVQQFAEIAIWNRCGLKPTTSELAELYHAHEILNIWGQRNTLHMYVREDWDLISNIYAGKSSGKQYHELFPREYASILEWIHENCSAKGIIHRKDLQAVINEKISHLLGQDDYFEYALIRACCLNGLFFGQPCKPGIKTFVTYQHIRPEQWRHDQNTYAKSIQDLMLRYFRHYGPATLPDFCHWSGLAQNIAKPALAAIAPLLTNYHSQGKIYYADGHITLPQETRDDLILLGKFDPLFVSYKHKEWIATDKQVKAIWQSAARVESVVLHGTQLLGTWRHVLKGRKMSLQISPFGKINAASKKKIAARTEKLAAFWDKQLLSVDYL